MSSSSEATAIQAEATREAQAEPERRLRSIAASPRAVIAQLHAELLAAVLTFGAYLAAWIAEGRQPFGRIPAAFGDESNQYAPIHAAFNRLLHGAGGGDLLFNWRSQYGVSFLPDFATYLTDPLSLPVFLVPTRDAATAELFVAPATMAFAAAVMARYLIRLGDGPSWIRALLASAYSLSTWAVFNSYIPMWLWGLVSFPMLCIAADWLLAGRAVTRRRLIGAALLFALAWYGNFYTGFIATLGSMVVLVLRLVSTGRSPREAWSALWRAALAAGIGIALTAPLVYPAFKASAAATPAAAGSGFDFSSAQGFIAELLPGTLVGIKYPAMIAVGVVGLLLALTFPANARLPRRVRVTWCVGAVAIALSFQWQPTSFIWHGLAAPHGNSYREAFVLSGVLVIVAWQSLCARPNRRAVAVAGLLFGAVLLAAVTMGGFPTWSFWLAVITAGLAGFVLAVYPGPLGRGRARHVAATAAVCAVGVAAVFPIARIHALRDAAGGRTDVVASSAIGANAAAVASVDAWPTYRTATGASRFVANEPMLLGGESADYYSSYVSKKSANLFHRIDVGSGFWGRGTEDVADPVLDAIFSTGARVTPGKSNGAPLITREQTAPLITVHTVDPADAKSSADNVFTAREALLGSQVYQVPDMTESDQPTRYTLACAPGSIVYWAAPRFAGRVRALHTTVSFGASSVNYTQPSVKLGTTPATGVFTVSVTPASGREIPAGAIGCLDSARLADVVASLTSSAASDLRVGGHSVSATVANPGTDGGAAAVIATVNNSGWQCSDNGVQGARTDFHGLLAVRLSAGINHVSCTFTPPGMRRGLALAGAAAGGLVLIAVWPLLVIWVRRNRGREKAA